MPPARGAPFCEGYATRGTPQSHPRHTRPISMRYSTPPHSCHVIFTWKRAPYSDVSSRAASHPVLLAPLQDGVDNYVGEFLGETAPNRPPSIRLLGPSVISLPQLSTWKACSPYSSALPGARSAQQQTCPDRQRP